MLNNRWIKNEAGRLVTTWAGDEESQDRVFPCAVRAQGEGSRATAAVDPTPPWERSDGWFVLTAHAQTGRCGSEGTRSAEAPDCRPVNGDADMRDSFAADGDRARSVAKPCRVQKEVMPLADRKFARAPSFAPIVVLLLVLASIAAGVVLFEHIERGLTMLVAPSYAASANVASPLEKSAPSLPAAADSDYFPGRFVNQAKEIEAQPPTF